MAVKNAAHWGAAPLQADIAGSALARPDMACDAMRHPVTARSPETGSRLRGALPH